MFKWLVTVLSISLLLLGCGKEAKPLETEWEPSEDDSWHGKVQLLMPQRSSEGDMRRAAEQTLKDALKQRKVAFLSIDFTDTTIYYGARFNLARVEFRIRKNPEDFGSPETDGLVAHWVWREKALKPDKPRPSDDEIQYYGLTFKSIIGAPMTKEDVVWLGKFTQGQAPQELENTFIRVQAWLFD